jgi:hypothetical protein
VNGTRKQTKKEDTNKLTTLAFKMIPILHNTLLATPKIKFFLGLLPIFGAHQPTHQPQFLLAQTQILLWGICPFGEAPKLIFYSEGLLPILGAHWGLLGFRGSKSNFTLGAFFLLGNLPNSNFTPGLLPILGVHWGLLGFIYTHKVIQTTLCT